MTRTGTITVAAGQISARLMNEAAATLAEVDETIASAAEQGAELLVLPECAYPAYLLGSIGSYRAGDHLSSVAFLEWLRNQAARRHLHIVCGFVEDTGDRLHNAAVLIDDQGCILGQVHKRFLWHTDHAWFTPGTEIRAVDSRLGRIGILICADARVPEIVATLAADGAELLAMPTCWINTARQPGQFANIQVEFLIEARAREFSIPFVCADKCGQELPPIGYVGQSRIVAADGALLAEAPADRPAVIVADIQPRPARPSFISEPCRARLLDARPTPMARRRRPKRITVAVVPGNIAKQRATEASARAWWESFRGCGVNLLISDIEQQDRAEQLFRLARAFDIHAALSASCAEVFDLGPARVGCLVGQSIHGFAPARALALDGAEVLLVFDMPDDLALLRTRAAENRVFLLGVTQRTAVIIGPGGEILASCDRESPIEIVLEIDLSEAAEKLVAPETDIFVQRQPRFFRL